MADQAPDADTTTADRVTGELAQYFQGLRDFSRALYLEQIELVNELEGLVIGGRIATGEIKPTLERFLGGHHGSHRSPTGEGGERP